MSMREEAETQMLLTFRLDGEPFAFPVVQVNEVLDPIAHAPVPNADAFAPGVINVRGIVVPLLDIRHRLQLPKADPSESNRIIVFEEDFPGGRQKLAFQADCVEQVIECTEQQLESLPELGAVWPRQFVTGAFQHEGELVVLLDSKQLFMPAKEHAEASVQ